MDMIGMNRKAHKKKWNGKRKKEKEKNHPRASELIKRK
jgi:hypothetical protein